VFIPSLVCKLSFAMVTLALVLLIQREQGSFALAGLATGLFGITNVISAPIRARLIDRFGQRGVLSLLALAYAAFLVAFVISSQSDASALIVISAGAAGLFPPPAGASMRVLWSAISPSEVHKTRAYGLDAVAEELIFTVGPLVVTGVILVWSPAGAVLCAAAFGLMGTLGMTTSAISTTHGVKSSHPGKRHHLGALASPGMVPMLVTLTGVGIVLGSIEILAAAIAERLGSTNLAGAWLAAFALGSAAGGLLYGARTWPGRATQRLVALAAAMSVATGILLLLSNSPVIAIALIAVGFFLAPALVTGYLLADDLTEPHLRTEASAWINTAINAGAALSVASAGVLVDWVGLQAAIIVCSIAAALCVVIAGPRLLALTSQKRGEDEIAPSNV